MCVFVDLSLTLYRYVYPVQGRANIYKVFYIRIKTVF